MRHEVSGMKMRWFFGLIGALVTVILSGCSFDDTVVRNIRIIVQAEVDGEIVEGSAVMGIRWKSGRAGAMHVRTNTEAVILELKNRGTVYVTDVYMSPNGTTNRSYWPLLIVKYFGLDTRHAYSTEEELPKIRSLEGRYPVKPLVGPLREMPVMVSFRDEAKRETMFRVKPGDFSRVFGSGVHYVGMWFEFTDDEPTDSGLRKRLPILWNANPSYRKTFPLRKANGDLFAGVEKALPQKIGNTSFFQRRY